MVVANNIVQRISYVLLLQFSLLIIIDNIEQGANFPYILSFVMITLALSIIVTFIDKYLALYYTPKIHEKLSCILQLQIFCVAKQVDVYNFDDPKFYEKYNRTIINTDGKIFEMFNNTILMIANFTSILALLYLFIVLSPLALIFIILPFKLSILNSLKTGKLNYNLSKQITNNNRKQGYVNRVFFDIAYIKEIKIHRVSSLLMNMLRDAFDISNKIYDTSYKYMMLHKKTIPFIIDFLIGKIIYISALLYQVITLGTLTIGGFSALFFASGAITGSLSGLHRTIINHIDISRFITEIIDFNNIKEKEDSTAIKDIKPDNIQVEDLGFSYSENQKKIIDKLSMSISLGKKVAIVGANGAGKTTLIKLLLGLYIPQEGKISLGNKEIKHIDNNKYISMFGVVFQDYNIYSLSLLENVIMDRAFEDDYIHLENDIFRTLKNSDFIIDNKLVNGLKTRLTKEFSQKDIKLSIGQEQKIAISRVLYSDKQYIVLDEPSSSLDPEAEFNFNNTIAEYSNDKTIILISHRLSTTKNADIIYVINESKIVESGTHDYLMKLNGLYCKMFQTQASKYTN